MSPNDPAYDDTVCVYCGADLIDEPNPDSWQYRGYCDAVCAGFFLIGKAKWEDDHIHANNRREMMAAFGNLSRFVNKLPLDDQRFERDLALEQITGEPPEVKRYVDTKETF